MGTDASAHLLLGDADDLRVASLPGRIERIPLSPLVWFLPR